MPRGQIRDNGIFADNVLQHAVIANIDPLTLAAVKQELKLTEEEHIDEDYQKLRELNLRTVDLSSYLNKSRLEAQKRFLYREQYCTNCVRRNICEKIGAVCECSLYCQEDPEFSTNNRRNRVRGV